MKPKMERTKNRAIRIGGLAFLALGAFWAFAKEPKAPPEACYNPATVIDVVATVSDIHILPSSHPLEGVHLDAVSRTGRLDVYLAPANFLRMLKVDFAKGDEVHVIGSKVKFENADVLLVRDITTSAANTVQGRHAVTELHLRNDAGDPVWENRFAQIASAPKP